MSAPLVLGRALSQVADGHLLFVRLFYLSVFGPHPQHMEVPRLGI